MMIPFPVLMVPLYGLFKTFGWIGTLLPLWVPACSGGGFNIFLLRQFFLTIPRDLSDAARIDGASDLRTYSRVALPLLRPGLATVAIFSALAAWNEFLLALLYIQDDDLKTIPTGLLAFSSRYQTDYSMLFSALAMVTIPMIVIYIVFNRHIVDGITAGSVK